MKTKKTISSLPETVKKFILEYAEKNFEEPGEKFESNAIWKRFGNLGTMLWVDSGSIEECRDVWTEEFSALTTNNTLLNREIQKCEYDDLILEARDMLCMFEGLSKEDMILEIGFILNACHGLRLVKYFDCHVSVEEHTDIANDVERAVAYGRRFNEICPEKFYVKVPFTPGGLLATRKLSAEGVAVNHTLGFSARQNFVIASISKPAFVNVFLGRLGSFVADNELGDGVHVGEKATLASQGVVRHLREKGVCQSKQIGASLRNGHQVADLAGLDVITMPPKVAHELLGIHPVTSKLSDKCGMNYQPGSNSKEEAELVGLDNLWVIEKKVVVCVEDIEKENLDSFSGDDIVSFFEDHGCDDVLVEWSSDQIDVSRNEGKIPKLVNWREGLVEKRIGLDSLMNLAGLNSFASDQAKMDGRIESILKTAEKSERAKAESR